MRIPLIKYPFRTEVFHNAVKAYNELKTGLAVPTEVCEKSDIAFSQREAGPFLLVRAFVLRLSQRYLCCKWPSRN